MSLIRKGDTVKIRKEFQDPGDDKFTWVALDDEDKGRVTISPSLTHFKSQLRQIVSVSTLEPKNI